MSVCQYINKEIFAICIILQYENSHNVGKTSFEAADGVMQITPCFFRPCLLWFSVAAFILFAICLEIGKMI